MTILAIDTALGAASACVLMPGQNEPISGETLLMERGQAEALVPLIDRVMARAAGGFDALTRVAVTVGPGSFTGIRIGIAAARAIGLARAVPVVGVSVLASLAAPVVAALQGGTAVAVIDARHGQVFVQQFDGAGTALAPPRIAALRDAARALGEGPLHCVGSGARLLVAEAKLLGVKAIVAGMPPAPEIAFVARLGAAADPHTAPPRPLYLKAPDANPQTGGRIARA